MKQRKVIAILLVTVAFYAACGKKNGGSGNCRLSRVNFAQSGFTDTFTLIYNSDNKIADFTNSNGGIPFTRSYSYSGNLLKMTYRDPGSGIDSVLFNNAGQVIYISLPNGSDTTHLHFSYRNDGTLLSSTAQHQQNDPISTSFYQISNGDIAIQLDSLGGVPGYIDTVFYAYLPDKVYSDGDYLGWHQLLNYGVVPQKSGHLVNSIRYGTNGTYTNINYSFDSQGRVSGFTDNTIGLPTTSEQATFNYSCDYHVR